MSRSIPPVFLLAPLQLVLLSTPAVAGSGAPPRWAESARVPSNSPSAFGHFGSGITIDGNTLAVRETASASVFVRTGATWSFEALIFPPASGFVIEDEPAIALDADNLAIGRPTSTPMSFLSSQYGRAFIYHRTGTTWALEYTTPLFTLPFTHVGQYVAMDGDRACISSQFGDDPPVSLLKRSGTTWSGEASFPLDSNALVNAVALQGDSFIVTRRIGGTIGEARVFHFDGAAWQREQTIPAENTRVDDQFGHSADVDGDVLVLGAPLHDAFGTDAGAAYVFRRNAGTWSLQAKLSPCDAAPGLQFGRSVAIEGSTIVVGAQDDVPPYSALGAVYVFRRSGGVWKQSQKLTVDAEATTGGFGVNVAMDGGTIVAGALHADAGAQDSGVVIVFDLQPDASSNFCFGDGSGMSCPCGNSGAAGYGCAHSFDPAGARLDAYGEAKVGADSLVLSISNGPPGLFCSFVQGSTQEQGGLGSHAYDGLQCVSGALVRLGKKSACGGSAVYPQSGDLPVSIKGAIPPGGGTRYYQGWYRNVLGPCGTNANLTNGCTVTWLP